MINRRRSASVQARPGERGDIAAATAAFRRRYPQTALFVESRREPGADADDCVSSGAGADRRGSKALAARRPERASADVSGFACEAGASGSRFATHGIGADSYPTRG
jgi:hypothetical protein